MCIFCGRACWTCWQSSCISDWEVNTLHCSCFLCLALAAFSFAHDWLWPGRAALALPFALSAVQAFQPDSAEKLAVRLGRQEHVLACNEGRVRKLLWDLPMEILYLTGSGSVGTSAVGLLTRDHFFNFASS